jgi:hypothetical protein
MFVYAGKIAYITHLSSDGYLLGIDNGHWIWRGFMFDPGYKPAEGPLSAEDAVIAMVQGKQTLYDKDGFAYIWDRVDKKFQSLRKDALRYIERCLPLPDLYRPPEKHNRDMTKEEVKAWAASDEGLGWMVAQSDIGVYNTWFFPRDLTYTRSDISTYRCARIKPDLSGIDESTIRGFEVEG